MPMSGPVLQGEWAFAFTGSLALTKTTGDSTVDQNRAYQKLLRSSLIALILCAVLVALCYFLVDRPVAFFVKDQQLNRSVVLEYLTYPPPYFGPAASIGLVALLIRRAWGPFRRWEQTLLAACLSLLLTIEFKNQLKFAFGRTWPDTWIQDNPSLLGRNGVYGFFPFQNGEWKENAWYASFPSGHTARVLALVSVVWIVAPWWRWACVAATAIIAVSLIGMNYHFVSDVIAGGFLGGLVGAWTVLVSGAGGPAACFKGAERFID